MSCLADEYDFNDEPVYMPSNHLINSESLVYELLHLRMAEEYLVEMLTPEVFLDFCDNWSLENRARVMYAIEGARARGNKCVCRHKPGGKFQWMEIHRDIDEDIEFLMPWLRSDAAWDPLNGEAEVHTIHPFILA